MKGKIISREIVGNDRFSLRWLRISNECNGCHYEKMRKTIVKKPMVEVLR